MQRLLIRVSVAVLSGSLLIACGEKAPEEAGEASPEAAADPGPKVSSGDIVIEDDEVAGALDQARGITTKEGRIKQEQAKFLDLADDFQKATGKTLQGTELSPGEAAILRSMLAKEQDVDTKGLLQEILSTRDRIQELEQQIEQVKGELPEPSVVQRGDTHLGLAVGWLEQVHGLDKKEADKLARRTLLTDQLAPGMEVWHFYSDGVYGTTVTQGTAKVSPYFMNMHSFQTMKRERDEALELAASLEAEIQVLEATRDQLQRDLRRAEDAREAVEYERDVLTEERDGLVTKAESTFFYIDTRRRLREKDLITPVGIRLKDWRPELFTDSLDLRQEYEIRVEAGDFGVKRINGVKLLPEGMFREGDDYSVRLDETKWTATITLENTSKFRNEAFVVVLK